MNGELILEIKFENTYKNISNAYHDVEIVCIS